MSEKPETRIITNDTSQCIVWQREFRCSGTFLIITLLQIYLWVCFERSFEIAQYLANLWRTRMWANAQRNGRPSECRWRPVFNAANFGWRALHRSARVPCSNAAKTRNPLKFAGVPQTGKPISAVSGPMFDILWGHADIQSATTEIRRGKKKKKKPQAKT